MNRRNGIHFLKSYIDFLISLGGETLMLLVRMQGAPKEDSNAPTKQEIDTQEMVKDLIDRTVLTYLKKTLLLLMVDREWNPHSIHNEALKSRLYLDENIQGDFPQSMATVYPVQFKKMYTTFKKEGAEGYAQAQEI
jgi:preprotein translocase subunit SecA